jgi:UDP-N-acetylglucosamine--N-acetylmuramyl-(pentapeptide) pyrophosphoryl-undecaprenol N-acetylglucosamine transferase
LAVANEIKERYEDAQIMFVGAKGKMEMTKVPEAGFKIVGLWISGLQRRITLDNVMFPIKVIYSFLMAKKIVKSYKPDAVLGFGGYASGPMMFAANSLKVPSLIQEQNSYAGLTNKKFGKKAQKICVAYDGMDKYFPASIIAMTGNPVRKDILDISNKRDAALVHFKLNANKKTILVLGGSLGARTINNSVLGELDKIVKKGYQLIWQTGKFYFEEINSRAKTYDLTNIRVVQFIKEMDLAYAAADVVISRAGALSISELCIVGKPVVLVPSPNVAEDHQTKNAAALTSIGAAVMVTDSRAKDNLIAEVVELLKDDERQKVLSNNIKTLAKPNAAVEIVNELMEMIK